ncbi:MAG: peptidoglycan-binding protein [Polyangiaceae bacterium]
MADESGVDLESTDDLPGAQVSEAGVAALLARAEDIVFSVAPTTASTVNTLRPALRPSACWRIDDTRFAFDSSFIRPDAAVEFGLLAALRAPDASGDAALLMSVFGHADPSGKDDYNKTLSGRRANAVYGLLVRDVDLWEELYSNPFGGDKWSVAQVQIMLRQVGQDDATNSGVLDRGTERALKQFQSQAGLQQTGAPDRSTRKVLFLQYMDSICQDGSAPFQYQKTDFLSKGADPEGKANRQGCGEFNPVLVFSQEEAKEFEDPKKKGQRDADNLSNRRVVVYMFSPTLPIDLAAWPCPTVKAGVAGCKAQFFSDGEQRRSPQERPRQYLKRGRTLACKFYDRIARGSPCEAVRQNLVIFLLDAAGAPTVNTAYRLTSSGQVREGRTDAEGRVVEPQVLVGLTCQVEWGVSNDDGSDPRFPHYAEVFLNTDSEDEDARVTQRRLSNLGYRSNSDRRNRKAFELEYDDKDSSDDAVKLAHESGRPKQTRVEST